MTRLLLHMFIPAGSDPKDPEVRRRYGTLSGATGIVLNLLLFFGKFVSGIVTGSIAVVADAVNNLSDAASSVMTLVGFRLAGQAADQGHPFGHGRVEYLTGLMVSLAILLMGFEIGKTSAEKILRPQTVEFSWAAASILVLSIAAKLWMFVFNRTLGRMLESKAMEATAADSLSDAVSTGVLLAGLLAGHFLRLPLDGWLGVAVALFILRTGWEAAKDTIDPLLGRPMDAELARDIDRLATGHDGILGIHDLVYHDYGPGRAMMSFHAEVPADGDLLEMHDLVDHIERELKERHGIETVIHMDPVVNDERTRQLREQVAALAREVDHQASIHDFRMTPGPRHTNVIFDMVLPYNSALSDQEAKERMERLVRTLGPRFYPVIQVDHSFVDQRDSH